VNRARWILTGSREADIQWLAHHGCPPRLLKGLAAPAGGARKMDLEFIREPAGRAAELRDPFRMFRDPFRNGGAVISQKACQVAGPGHR
jgi:hypothetical protein